MPTSNRLSRKELREEVKDYLIALREDRIRRSVEVSERLKQLRVERIERLQQVRNSLTVTDAIREKTTEEFSRKKLRDRVLEMRSEVQDMLKQYRAIRAGDGYDDVEDSGPAMEAPKRVRSSAEEESLPVDNTKIARALDYGKPAHIREEQESSTYRNRLGQMVNELGRQDSERKEPSPEKKQDDTLIGRIRRLASGEYRSKPGKEITPDRKEKVEAEPEPARHLEDQNPVRHSRSHTNGASTLSAGPSANVETIHTVIKRPPPSFEQESPETEELLEIDGIGPSVLKRLRRIGICTFQDLASTSLTQLEDSFGEYSKLTDLGEWVDQAKAKIRQVE